MGERVQMVIELYQQTLPVNRFSPFNAGEKDQLNSSSNSF